MVWVSWALSKPLLSTCFIIIFHPWYLCAKKAISANGVLGKIEEVLKPQQRWRVKTWEHLHMLSLTNLLRVDASTRTKNVFQCEATFSLAGRVGWIKSRAKGRRSKKSLASANVICEGPPQTFKMVTSNGNEQFQGTGQGGRPPPFPDFRNLRS